MDRADRFALPGLLAGAAAIAFAPIFVRLSPLDPSATAFYRLALALPVLWLWMSFEARQSDAPPRPATRKDFGWLALAGLFFAGDLAVWHWSIHFTSVANSTLLANCAPVFVTLGARMFFGEKITLRFIGGMCLALMGAAVVVGAQFGQDRAHLIGDALGVLTAIFYAAYMLTLKRLRARFSTATIMSWSGLVSACVLMLVAALSRESFTASSITGWSMLLGLAWISHVGGQSLIAYAFAHLPASFSSVGLLLQPAIAALLAWLILSEPLTLWQSIGGLAVIAGIMLARLRR